MLIVLQDALVFAL